MVLEESHKEDCRPSDCLSFYFAFAVPDISIKTDIQLNKQRALNLMFVTHRKNLVFVVVVVGFFLQTFATALRQRQEWSIYKPAAGCVHVSKRGEHIFCVATWP